MAARMNASQQPGFHYADPATVVRLTGRKRFAAQRRALDGLGIKYQQAATGEPLVLVSDLEGDRRNRTATSGPRWERLRKA